MERWTLNLIRILTKRLVIGILLSGGIVRQTCTSLQHGVQSLVP
jgi:hypothetical protein